MRVLAVLAVLALLGVSAFNALQIRELKQEVSMLQEKIRHNEESRLSDEIVSQATIALMKARTAVTPEQARAALDTVSGKLQEAAKVAGERSKPALNWLRNESNALSKDLQNRIGGR